MMRRAQRGVWFRAFKIAGFLMALAGMSMPPLALADSMFMPMDFSVGKSGSANIGVPLRGLPGLAGMQPSLGLSYSSMGANGLVGMGWSLGGMSAIARCGSTMQQDGAVGGVNYDGNDRFCLDGQRLVLLSGAYGADGSEYRTEIDTQQRVIAYGNQAGAPAYFKAWNKSGQIMEYGNTADSRIVPPGVSIPIVWALNRTLDRKSNYIDWSYSAANGEWYPAEVRYTGNFTTGQAPANKFVFDLESRPDATTQYHAGHVTAVRSRLKAVRAVQNGSTVLTHKISYAPSDSSLQESHVASLQTCWADDTQCLPSLQFSWGTSAFAQQTVSGSLDRGYDAGRQWVDVSGDGLPDFCRVVGSSGSFRLACTLMTPTGLGTMTYTSPVLDAGYEGGRQWVDVNGDGLADYCRVVGGGSSPTYVWCTLSSGSGFGSTIQSESLDAGYDDARWWVDFNADGRADFCRQTSSGSAVLCTMTTGNGFGATATSEANISRQGGQWADANGDGLPDFCGYVSSGNDYVLPMAQTVSVKMRCTLNNGGTGFGTSFVSDEITEAFGPGAQWVDLNGDGLSDYCAVLQNGIRCAMSTGTSITTWTSTAALDLGDENGRQFVDVNGDGFADFCRVVGGPSAPRIACTLFNGSGFGDTLSFAFDRGPAVTSGVGGIQITTYPWMNYGRFWIDANSDGRADFCRWMGDNGDQVVCIPFAGDARRIVSIGTQGISQATYAITYKPLRMADYARSMSGAYPRATLTPTFSVVDQTRAVAGVGGGVRTTNYRYGDFIIELGTGRGPMGFAWQEARDVDTGVVTRSSYSQVFPTVGMPTMTTRSLNGAQLAITDNTYDFFSFTNFSRDSTPQVGVGKRYVVYNSRTQDLTWDLGGQFISGSRTTRSELDDQGSVRTIKVESIDQNRDPQGFYIATGHGKTTVTNYSHDIANWLIGRPTLVTVNASAPGAMLPAGAGSASNASTISGTPFYVPPAGRAQPAVILAAMANMFWDAGANPPKKKANPIPIVNYLLD